MFFSVLVLRGEGGSLRARVQGDPRSAGDLGCDRGAAWWCLLLADSGSPESPGTQLGLMPILITCFSDSPVLVCDGINAGTEPSLPWVICCFSCSIQHVRNLCGESEI